MPLARSLALASLLAVAGGARAEEPRPTLELRCTADADCASTLRDEACCVGCWWHAGTKAAVDAHDRACTAKPNAACPPMDCPPADPSVACVKGRCVLKSGVTPPPAKVKPRTK